MTHLTRQMSTRKREKDFHTDVMDALTEMRDEIAGIKSQPAVGVGRLVAIYNAAKDSRGDGQADVGDCVDAAGILATMVSAGVIGGLGLAGLTGEIETFVKVSGGFTFAGAIGAGVRLMIEPGFYRIRELGEFLTAYNNGEWARFKDDQLAQRLGVEPQEVKHSAVIEMRESDTVSHFLGLENRPLTLATEFARTFLATGGLGTSEKTWVEDGLWTGSREEFVAWREWCIDKGLAWVTDKRGKWEFKRWGLAMLAELAKMELSPHPTDAQ